MSKIKMWIKENKSTALGIGLGAVATGVVAVVSYKTGINYALVTSENGFKKVHEAGIVKFFNPDTGLEVSEVEVCKIIKEKFGI